MLGHKKKTATGRSCRVALASGLLLAVVLILFWSAAAQAQNRCQWTGLYGANAAQVLAAASRSEASSLVASSLVQSEIDARGTIHGRMSAYPSLSAWYKAEGSSLLRYFADRGSVPAGQAPAMAYLIYHHVIQGDAQSGDLYLHPAAHLTGGQAAVLIRRAEAVELDPAAREAPAVTAVGPVEGLRGGGGSLVIDGSGFQGATSVTFGHRVIHSAGFRVDSDTQITVKAVPAGSGTVHVSVTTPLGRSSAGSQDTYRYLATLRVGDRTVAVALHYLGVPYVWAGEDADGFDCSGLVRFVFGIRGVSLPHYAAFQYAAGTPVAREELRPGDLVFFYHPIEHVAIYLGNGNMITAPRPGASVCIEPVLWSVFVGARRISG